MSPVTKGHLHSSLGDRDNMPLQPESLVLQGAPPVAPPRAQLPMIKVERRPSSACELQTSGLLGYRLEREGKVRECGAAFGCLAELATRRGGLGSPLRAPQVTPQVDLLSPPLRPTSRPTAQQEEDHRSPIERCKPPYSREWLLAHRARCGGSPLRPTALNSVAPLPRRAALPLGIGNGVCARCPHRLKGGAHASPTSEPCVRLACG